MFLMETKNDDEYIKSKLQSLHYTNYFSVPPAGTGGGLGLLWKDNITIEILESSLNIIDAKVSFKGSYSFISFVYGAPAVENKAAFWSNVTRIGEGRDSPWLLTGDFNEILGNHEQNEGRLRSEAFFKSSDR